MSAGYYQIIKEMLQKSAYERCQDLSESEKNWKRKYGRERYKNSFED